MQQPELHLPTLMFIASIVMAATGTIMGFFGLSQRVYRGFWSWTAAMWLATFGALAYLFSARWPFALALGNAMLLAWPVLIVVGLRRFYSRDRAAAPGVVDASLYALCLCVWLVLWLTEHPRPVRGLAMAANLTLLHGYAAWLIARLPQLPRSRALKALFTVMLLQALVPVPRIAYALTHWSEAAHAPTLLLVPGTVIPTLVAMLFTVYLCLLLTYERTEGDLRETQRRLRVLADMDMLTQVPNRRHFEEQAQALLQSPASAVLMLFDIDHFKAINDSFGHARGDEALRVVARCTHETLRSRDCLGRIGGDEFAALLSGATVDDALLVADRVSRTVEERYGKAGVVPLSLSFGIVQIEPGETLHEAMQRADIALYQAKRQGRARAVSALHGEEHTTIFGESRPLGLAGGPA
jgi:diguanylate cyclase (GGDEF)-like protein